MKLSPKKPMYPRVIGGIALLLVYAASLFALMYFQFFDSDLYWNMVNAQSAKVTAPPPKPEPAPEPEPVATFEAAAEETKAEASFDGINLRAFYDPQYFSPDGDGHNDELYITLGVDGGKNIASWNFDIFQSELAGAKQQIFKHFSGKGVPNEKLTWDGRADSGALVQAATDYPYAFTVTDTSGQVSEPLKGVIHVDILVHREDDGRLRIQVPSIIFRTNAADFNGLPPETIAANQRAIRRLATILNAFPDYKVRVEGHANPEQPPGTPERAEEEKLESQSGSVSEQRAQAIVRMLAENGVGSARLTAVGMGVSSPIVPYTDRADWWQNRRVEFFLVRVD